MHKRLIMGGLFCCIIGVAVGLFFAFNHDPSSQYGLLGQMDIRKRCSKIMEVYQNKEYIRAQQFIKELQQEYPRAPETKEISAQLSNIASLAVKEDIEGPTLKLAEKLKHESILSDADIEKMDNTGTSKMAFKYEELVDAYIMAMKITYAGIYSGLEYTSSSDKLTIYVNNKWADLTPDKKRNLVKQSVVFWGAIAKCRNMPVDYNNFGIKVISTSPWEKVASWDGQVGYTIN